MRTILVEGERTRVHSIINGFHHPNSRWVYSSGASEVNSPIPIGKVHQPRLEVTRTCRCFDINFNAAESSPEPQSKLLIHTIEKRRSKRRIGQADAVSMITVWYKFAESIACIKWAILTSFWGTNLPDKTEYVERFQTLLISCEALVAKRFILCDRNWCASVVEPYAYAGLKVSGNKVSARETIPPGRELL